MAKKVDLTGQKFGRLTVIEFSHRSGDKKHYRYYWLCKCDCNNEKIVRADKLTSGHTQSCGCMSMEFKNLVGLKFGRLTVLSLHPEKIHGLRYWKCICECGTEVIVRGESLTKNKSTKSCGCLNAESNKQRSGANSPVYNHNLTLEERIMNRNYPEYREWVFNVFKRDNFICQCCGAKDKYLNAHHIKNYLVHKELRLNLSNGITLCKFCHGEFHKIYTRFNNNQEQLDEFIKDYKENTGESICQSA